MVQLLPLGEISRKAQYQAMTIYEIMNTVISHEARYQAMTGYEDRDLSCLLDNNFMNKQVANIFKYLVNAMCSIQTPKNIRILLL